MAVSGRKNGRTAVTLALAGGDTVATAAQKGGVGERTVYRWLQEDGFRQEVAHTRATMFAQALGRMAEGAVSAVVVLRQLCLKGKSESVRLSAARSILELGNKLRESVELEERLQALEQQFA